MKTLPEVHDTLDRFDKLNSVGMLVIHRAPGGKMLTFEEQTIKVSELDSEFRAALEILTLGLSFFKAEITCRPDGKPDRIKITRSL